MSNLLIFTTNTLFRTIKLTNNWSYRLPKSSKARFRTRQIMDLIEMNTRRIVQFIRTKRAPNGALVTYS